jgi:predicted enzyme involved in methoxymalonyl-ACP biosynthesis
MVTGRLAMDTEKNRFDKLQQEQRDLDASYRQSLKNKKEREEQEDNEEYLKQLKDKL